MHKTGGTQQLYGLWDAENQAWIRDSGGSVALHGKAQAQALADYHKRLVLKEVFICCAEALDDSRLPALQQKWLERGYAKS